MITSTNRYGFNSDGHEIVYKRLQNREKGKSVLHAHREWGGFIPVLFTPGVPIRDVNDAHV